MAKRSITKMSDLWNVDIDTDGPGKCLMTLTGKNSKNTDVKVTVRFDDYYLKDMAKGIAKATKQRLDTAINLSNTVKNIING